MQIQLKQISVRDIVKNYVNNNEDGITGYNGNLNIRPKYQREFVYKDKQRDAVIETLRKGFPLNVMYWVMNDNNTFEVLDGQQRTISVCEYVNNGYSIKSMYFSNLTQKEKDQILDYEFMIYFCEGEEREKLDWFKTINISGEKLTEQELRNAIYTGEWLTDAKKYFSKTGCVAYSIASNLLNGAAIRQDYLETALDWVSDGNINDYMAKNQHKPNANELWMYFSNVITWVRVVFPNYRKEMKGLNYGEMHALYSKVSQDSVKLESRIVELLKDEDVTKKAGIFPYLLSNKEKHLSIRSFSNNQKREAFENQKGVCVKCQKTFTLEEMEADHITPWSEGGKTTSDNCQMLCKHDNRIKSNN